MKSYRKIITPLYLSGFACFSLNVYSSDLALNELSNLSELQIGYENMSSVELDGAYNSRVTIEQKKRHNGLGNAAKVKQSGNHNHALIVQDGNDNKAYVNQEGDYNFAAILEGGYGNYGVIQQYGNNNEAAILQHGQNNQGKITQYGDDNKALIVHKSNVQYFKSDINQTGGQTHVIINGMNKSIKIQ